MNTTNGSAMRYAQHRPSLVMASLSFIAAQTIFLGSYLFLLLGHGLLQQHTEIIRNLHGRLPLYKGSIIGTMRMCGN